MAFQSLFFDEALKEARLAYADDEVPVGAVVVSDEQIIARAHNQKERDKDCLSHAELLAIAEAQRVSGDWRLTECDLYVTLEPCVMCMGAIFHARFRSVYYGAISLTNCSPSTVSLGINLFFAFLNVYPFPR